VRRVTEKERDEIVEQLAARMGGGSAPATGSNVVPLSGGRGFSGVPDRQLDSMVSAGACRFGVRADRPEDAGFSACDLAPPLARMIDHTALKPQTKESDIRELCDEARRYCFASVCVSPCYVPLAAELLRGTPVATCTVIGFPHGMTQSSTKAAEADRAIQDGATEIDMVINIGMMRSGRYDYVESDIRGVVTTARSASPGIIVKVILETALLDDREKVIACVLAQNAGADFVKTSTGFASGGATEEDIAMMRRAVGPRMGVKASGGVRSKEDAERMIARGATRIGASASVAIVKGEKGSGSY
jgi:deoxyribose-phosphate aldolase